MATRWNNIPRRHWPIWDVYQLTPSGKLTTTYQFDGPHGSFPIGSLVQATDGNLYGTTAGFGFINYGTILKIVPSGDFALTLLFSSTWVA